MKLLITFILGAALTCAQSQQAVRRFKGSVNPGVVRGSGYGDVYVNTTTSTLYICTNPTTFCNGISVGNWVSTGTSPTTTAGDMIKRGASSDERLPVGSEGALLGVISGIPAYTNVSNINMDANYLYANTASPGDNTRKLATTSFVKALGDLKANLTDLVSLGTANQVAAVNGVATLGVYKTLTAGSGMSISHSDSAITLSTTGGSSSRYLTFNMTNGGSALVYGYFLESHYVDVSCNLDLATVEAQFWGAGGGATGSFAPQILIEPYYTSGSPSGTLISPGSFGLSSTHAYRISGTSTMTTAGWTVAIPAGSFVYALNSSGASGVIAATITLKCTP